LAKYRPSDVIVAVSVGGLAAPILRGLNAPFSHLLVTMEFSELLLHSFQAPIAMKPLNEANEAIRYALGFEIVLYGFAFFFSKNDVAFHL
jgi:hypothetical protein